MRLLLRLSVILAVFMLSGLCVAQNESGPIKSSPAYAEVLLRKSEIMADLEALSADYTEANPRIIDLRAELTQLDQSLQKIFAVKASETGKLTLALGKLIVRRAAYATDLVRLTRNYNAEHPEIKRSKRRVEIFDAAIAEILK